MKKITPILLSIFFFACTKKDLNVIAEIPAEVKFIKPEEKRNPLSISHAREVIDKYKITKSQFKGFSKKATLSTNNQST